MKQYLPSFLVSAYHFLLAFVSAFFYQFPSKKIKVIGITGTNGKSTVVSIATQILEEAGYKVAASSSLVFKIGNRLRKTN